LAVDDFKICDFENVFKLCAFYSISNVLEVIPFQLNNFEPFFLNLQIRNKKVTIGRINISF